MNFSEAVDQMQKKKEIGVDLDATLAKYDGWKGLDVIGDPLDGAVEFTKRLSTICNVVIFTTRGNASLNDRDNRTPKQLKQLLKTYLDKHGFSYTDIWVGQGKPPYAAFVDDRAVECRPQDDDTAYETAFQKVKGLIGK